MNGEDIKAINTDALGELEFIAARFKYCRTWEKL